MPNTNSKEKTHDDYVMPIAPSPVLVSAPVTHISTLKMLVISSGQIYWPCVLRLEECMSPDIRKLLREAVQLHTSIKLSIVKNALQRRLKWRWGTGKADYDQRWSIPPSARIIYILTYVQRQPKWLWETAAPIIDPNMGPATTASE